VGARLADDLLAVLGVQLDADGVSHGAGRDEHARLFAKDFRGAPLEPVDGGVLAVNVVADLGLRHGAPHLGGRAGDGVAAQIDKLAGTHKVINS
jgi:hypothetical protein